LVQKAENWDNWQTEVIATDMHEIAAPISDTAKKFNFTRYMVNKTKYIQL
jgi:hypothetical protein